MDLELTKTESGNSLQTDNQKKEPYYQLENEEKI